MLPPGSELLFAALNCLGPFAAHLPQLRLPRASRTAADFPLAASALTICAGILRLLAWKAARFHASLLLQAVALVGLHGWAARAHFRAERAEELRDFRRSRAVGDLARAPAAERDFFRLLLLFFLAASLAAYACAGALARLPLLCSVGLEALARLPAYLRNRRARSVKGVSLLMILGWFAGDGLRLCMLVRLGQPWEFALCALAQLLFDYLTLRQFALYCPEG